MVLAGVPLSASAHPRLVRSTPADSAHLEKSPGEIRLVFSEAPMLPATHIRLISLRGDTIKTDAVRADRANAHIVYVSIPTALPAGSYIARWWTVAGDGHGAKGMISFTVGGTEPARTDSVAPNLGASTHDVNKKVARWRSKRMADAVQVALGAPMWLARWVAFIALFLLVGAAAFRHLILGRIAAPSADTEPFRQIAATGAATAGMFSAVVLVVATVIKLYGETEVMHEVPLRTMLMDTSWGIAWMVQITACIVAVAAFALAHRGSRSAWGIAALCAVVLSATPALTGHAISSDEAFLAVPVDITHVLAGSAWLGTLAIILLVGIPAAAKTPDSNSVGVKVALLVNAFSPIALVCGAAMVATGVATSLMHLEPLSKLWRSTYGMTLVVKLALVSLLFTLGAWNWRRVKPNLGGDEGVVALRFSAKLELAASVLVLAVTAFLVALPLPE
jgi:copper transport protein